MEFNKMKHINKCDGNIIPFNCKNKPRRIHSLRLMVSMFFVSVVTLSLLEVRPSHARIIETVAESPSKIDLGTGGTDCQNIETTSIVRRGGQKAFKHWVNRCGKRAELRTERTKIDGIYWYGWSIYIPSDWNDNDMGWDIINQWAAWPTKPRRKFTCGGVGSKITRESDTIKFDLQHQGSFSDIECTQFPLAKVSQIKGKWVDFVMNVKWTGGDGFLKLWMRTARSDYVQKINYQGSTFWNDEFTGPYFKMGLYKGSPNFKGPAPRMIYTDEYRLGDANSSFGQVAPGDGSQKLNNLSSNPEDDTTTSEDSTP